MIERRVGNQRRIEMPEITKAIRCDGKRQFEFVKQFDYIRESGTEGEHKAAEKLLEEFGEIKGTISRLEPFIFEDMAPAETMFEITSPYQKTYTAKGYLRSGSTSKEGTTAPFVYLENGDPVSLKRAAGAVVMVNGPVGAALYEALTKAGALGFLSISGTPLDEGEDRLPRQYRISRECGGKLPGACIHYLDACEIVEAGADKCHLKVVQKPCVRHSENVIARIEGTDPERKHQVVTVSAHYDSVPEGPGAYDNMAGCAMVVEACRFFAENPPKRTMEFILFGSEEKGLVGSQAYAAAHAEKITDHVFNLNVDLAGQLLGGNVLGVTADASVCEEIAKRLEEAEVPAVIKNEVWASDSNTFAWKGVPALTVNRDGFGMHTHYDTWQLISPWTLERGAKILCVLGTWLGNAEDFAFRREIPEEMQKKLNSYYEKQGALFQ